MLKESIRMSWSNILHNKMRSFLTVLGVIIGVASIIALVTIVQGATDSVTSQITALGADKISVQAAGTPLKQGLNSQDLLALAGVESVSGVSPTVSGVTAVVYGSDVVTGITIQGKNEVYFQKNADLLASGRAIQSIDVQGETLVAILGSQLARDLFYGVDPLGETILLRGISYTVIGVLAEEGGFSLSSASEAVLVPYTSAMKTLGTRNILGVDLYMSDATRSDAVIADVNAVLNEAFNYHEDTFRVFNMQDMISTIGSITDMMSLLLAGIASISLIVGGIGIMNMMLVSVTERTAEIGLRKALGAEPGRIQLQFLIESVFISIVGGTIGMLAGLLIALAAALLIGIPFHFSISVVLLAFGFSAAVGMIFGFAPARKASRLNPIEALRHA